MSNPFSVNAPDRKSDAFVKEPVPDSATDDEAAGSPSAGKGSVPQVGSKHGPTVPAPGMDEVSCRTCQYPDCKDFRGMSRSEARSGECRHHAPVPGADRIVSWPQVTREGWWGEWKSGVSDEDMVKRARAIADRRTEESTRGFQGSKTALPER